MNFHLAKRTQRMNPSVIREILKITERPGIISLAGGLPSADTFAVEAVREATARVLAQHPREALQYASSEGFGPLREWVAEHLRGQGMRVDVSQVLMTNGSQQGLDLVGKLLIDSGSKVLVETPTYVGALQAFMPYEPAVRGIESDDEGPVPEALAAEAGGARFAYLLPNFQNPTGHVYSQARREAIVAAARTSGVPLVEDNPYGDLWYDAPPPAPLAARWPEGVIYIGSFSKVLSPGLRLGYVVAPPQAMPKLLQCKQAADLHTAGFNQRIVHEIVRTGLLDTHVPTIRNRYRVQRDAMAAALQRHLGGIARWQVPAGGMFFWVHLPDDIDVMQLLERAIAAGVAFVPGVAFHAGATSSNTLRLSFVTVSADAIEQGIAALAKAVRALAANSVESVA